MSSSGATRSEQLTIRGLEPIPSATIPLDAGALAMEHVLASHARVEARLEATERGGISTVPPPRPDPDPPSSGPYQWPVYTHATSMSMSAASRPLLGDPLAGFTQGFSQPLQRAWGRELPNPHNALHQGTGRVSTWDLPETRVHGSMPRQPTSWDNPATRQSYGQQFDHPRQFKMHQPRFDGSDVANWISRVQYYFEHLLMPEENRLHYVVMLFDPPASEWIFNYRENNPQVRWSDFIEDVRRRFDPQYFQNFIGLIAKLCQTGTLAEYHTTFETMLNRVRGVPEYILLPIYIEGLQQPVKNQVKHQNPPSVAAAMALAIEYDSCVEKPPVTAGFQRRNWQNREQRQIAQPQQSLALPAPPTQQNRTPHAKGSEYAKMPVVRLTAAERAERSKLGLCWYCPEKWVAGHSCRGRFLVYMGADIDSDEESEEPPEEPQDNPVISADLSHIYALDGRQREDAIELRGLVGASSVRILVDTGSSHNFLHPAVAEKLALPLRQIRPFRVYVGNGESLLCSHVSIQTRLVIQTHIFG